jgi:hypothetical protein
MIIKYEDFLNEQESELTKEQIKWLDKVVDGTWIAVNGKIDVTGAVLFRENKKLKKIPVQFGKVSGYFNCSYCTSLTSLEGCPSSVGRYFYCFGCTSLTSLEGCPSSVAGDFNCVGCTSLVSLEGGPSTVSGDFYCSNCTSLTSLEGGPSTVSGDFSFTNCAKLPVYWMSYADLVFNKQNPEFQDYEKDQVFLDVVYNKLKTETRTLDHNIFSVLYALLPKEKQLELKSKSAINKFKL